MRAPDTLEWTSMTTGPDPASRKSALIVGNLFIAVSLHGSLPAATTPGAGSFTSVLSPAHAKPRQGAPEPPSMVRAQRGASEVAPSRSLSACQSVHVGSGQGVAAHSPVAAFPLLYQAPGDAAHALAFD